MLLDQRISFEEVMEIAKAKGHVWVVHIRLDHDAGKYYDVDLKKWSFDDETEVTYETNILKAYSNKYKMRISIDRKSNEFRNESGVFSNYLIAWGYYSAKKAELARGDEDA